MITLNVMSESARRRAVPLLLFGAWLAVVGYASWKHALWRDEVRALSKALNGSIPAMLKGLPPEGHPALWYLLLRGAHAVVPAPEIVQVLAFLIAAASALLVVCWSPFPWELQALLLAGNALLFEYSVMARNYGISMLLLFLLAVLYRRHKDHGVLLGILLLLLANSNAISVLLTGAFLIFWLGDIFTGKSADRARALRIFGWNAAIAMLGVVLCILTILPPAQAHAPAGQSVPGSRAAPISSPFTSRLLPGSKPEDLIPAVFHPGRNLEHLIPFGRPPDMSSTDLYPEYAKVLLSIILVGSTLGLARYPAAVLAALAALIAGSIFFAFVYAGAYRQEALWLVFLVAIYWVTRSQANEWKPKSERWAAWLGPVTTAGWCFFAILLAGQVFTGVENALAATTDASPFSCSRDFAEFLGGKPELHDAILMAEPEHLLEPMPYYLSNPLYFSREQSFGKFVQSSKTQPVLTLGEVLQVARSLHSQAGKPVIILLGEPVESLDTLASIRVYRELHNWNFVVTPEDRRAFLEATQLIERFPHAQTDESFDVYLLK